MILRSNKLHLILSHLMFFLPFFLYFIVSIFILVFLIVFVSEYTSCYDNSVSLWGLIKSSIYTSK